MLEDHEGSRPSSEFKRGIDAAALDALTGSGNGIAGWFADLLALWVPSGVPAGGDGLRLSVHGGQLDFYRQGSVIACVRFVGSEPRAHVARAYAEVGGKGILRWRGMSGPPGYRGVATLREWIARSESHHVSKREKRCVDEIVGINEGVVELEMALPKLAAESRDTREQRLGAPRVDIVAVEPCPAGFRVVFWEVKLHGDSRLVKSDEEVEVCKQLERFQRWLGVHRDQTLVAYRRVWTQLGRLATLASAIKAERGLAPIRGNPWLGTDAIVDVDPVPRLVVVEWGDRRCNANWNLHRKKLEPYPLLDLLFGAPMRLGSPPFDVVS